jgi:hypothetical protein
MDVCPLEHFTIVNAALELLWRHEEVIPSVYLTGTRIPGGHGDGKVKIWHFFAEAINHRGLSYGRWA